MTSDIMIPDASALTVDTSRIDVSEVESQEDKDFLMEKGENILRIEATAQNAIKQIVAAIQGRASVEKGKYIAEIQDRFAGTRTGKMKSFYESLEIDPSLAFRWAHAYRATAEFEDLFGNYIDPLKVLECSDVTLSKISSLPTAYRQEKLADIAAGSIPTSREIADIAKQPEVKLSKAEELLAEAVARKDNSATSQERRNNETAISNFEQQIADLMAQVEEEKLRTAEETEEKARVEKELQKLKFDDASARAERVKRVGSTLTLSIPQTLADVQKFFAESNEYPDEVRKHIVEQSTMLANYIGDHL